MTDAQKLEIAIEALQEIRKIDGMGADLSPPGPCFDVASRALSQLIKKKKRRSNRGLKPKCECEQGSNGTISGNDGRLEPADGCPRHNEEWKREHDARKPPRPNQFGQYSNPYKPKGFPGITKDKSPYLPRKTKRV